MKKLTTILLTVIFCLTATAQDIFKDPVQIMRERLTQGRVTVNYYFRTEAKVAVVNKGIMTIQGNCFCTSGSGLEYRADGHALWVIDKKEKEVYVEDFLGLEEFFSNPQIYAELLTDLKIEDKEISGTYHNGKNGEKTFFKMTNIKAAPADEDESIFKFETNNLDSEWLVTDLRESK